MAKSFWLDSNVLIQAHQGYYSFDIAPGFWSSIESHTKNGSLRSPDNVLKEILEGKDTDPLKNWAKGKGKRLFVLAGKDEQGAVGKITQYVLGNYPQPQATFFLAKADPWVIAHALVDRGIVVTQETLVGANSLKVKIPNVCNHFKVEWINTYDLLRKLNITLK
jgi:Domain of unknown function (DUF4411)